MNRKRSYAAAFENAVTTVAPYIPASAMALGRYIRPGRRVGRARRMGPQRRRPFEVGRQRQTAATQFNSGYSIVNKKAINTKRKISRRKRRSMKKKQINVAGKILRASVESIYKRLCLMNETELERGRLCLPSVKIAFPSGGGLPPVTEHRLPLMLIDITDVHHTDSNPIRTLYFSNTDTTSGGPFMNYYFSGKCYTKNNADGEGGGNTDSTYGYGIQQYEVQTSQPPANAYNINLSRKWYQHHAIADLLLYGQKNQDTLYRFDVVSFHSDVVKAIQSEASPMSDNETPLFNSGPNVSTTFTTGEWKQLWASLVAPYTQNPLYKRPRNSKMMKIHKSYKFKIPEQSSEFDKTPAVKTRIKIPINTTWNRFWNYTGMSGVNDPVNADPESSVALNNEEYQGSNLYGEGKVYPKYRKYLMIRATNTDLRDNPDNQEALSVDKGQDPTFDMNLRLKFSHVPV